MVKIKAPKSKRKSSSQRHKIERKKREHKRDLRKAAKSLKKNGMAPKRSKKAREMAQMALKISKAHPDKEEILNRVLLARENARVQKKLMKQGAEEDAMEQPHGQHQQQQQKTHAQGNTSRKQLLFISVKQSNDFQTQFNRSLDELVFPIKSSSTDTSFQLPSASYLVTLDCRFSPQCVPWGLLDAITERAEVYKGTRKVLVLFVLTKCDLVSAPAIVSQVSLLACALRERYEKVSSNLVFSVTPFSTRHGKLSRHLLRMLNQFRESPGCSSSEMRSNLDKKICAIVVGLPNTGRRSLCRALCEANESSVCTVPLKAAQIQLVRVSEGDTATVVTKFAIPNAKAVTLLQLPEDAKLAKVLRQQTGTDALFNPPHAFEKQLDPEAIGCVFFAAVADKVALFQAFCQPFATGEDPVRAGLKFMRDIGRTVRQEKGFYVSPLYSSSGAGTMGKMTSSNLTAHSDFNSGQQRSQETLLNATYSNATPSKLVRLSSYSTTQHKGKHQQRVHKEDFRNASRLGARTFVREVLTSQNLPWAVMRHSGNVAVTEEEVAAASTVFNLTLFQGEKLKDGVSSLKSMDHLQGIIDALSRVLKEVLPFLPNNVVEFDPDSIVPPKHELCDANEEGETVGETDSDDGDGAEEEDEDEELDDEEVTDDDDGDNEEVSGEEEEEEEEEEEDDSD